MVPNNNLSVLPWYSSIDDQNARKWWAYGRIYPLYVPNGYLLPFQIIRTHRANTITTFDLYTCKGGLVGHYITSLTSAGLTIKSFTDHDVIIFGGESRVFSSIDNGVYYAVLSDGVDSWYSDFFCVSDASTNLLKLTWYDEANLEMDGGVIVYKYGNDVQFKNTIYLPTEIARPTYDFTEEGEDRNGYFFAIKQISKKVYHFVFLAPEYMLDVLRFVRMSDHVEITQHGKTYLLDSFHMESTWQGDGDIASVDAEFTTATVAKKTGVGYIGPHVGDFNNDYNNDYYN